MAQEKMVNYTDQQTMELVQAYQNGVAVEQLAVKMGKTVRSVVAKLSREGVYVAKSKTSHARVTKAELVLELAALLDVQDVAVLESLEKCSHEALSMLVTKISE